MRSDFAVKIRHADKPMPGTTVEITGPQGTSGAKKFTLKTDKDGIARITNLAPGDYWLNAEYLDIGAAYHCFHVNERTSRKAKRKLAYDWGDLAPGTRRIAGKLLDSQPGNGGTPIWNLLHRVDVPIVAAKLTLQNATTRVEPDRDYEASDHLVSLGSTAKRNSLLLKRQEASGGSCGGTSLELQESTDNS